MVDFKYKVTDIAKDFGISTKKGYRDFCGADRRDPQDGRDL